MAEQDPKVAEVADRLYRLPPGRFVAERTGAATAAREAGDRATAAELGRLRRPTVAAWLVNLLALERPELVDQLGELAGALRAAQRDLAGGQLRQLANQRRTTVAALVAEARALAQAADPAGSAGKLPLAEVEATLHAALSDPDVAAQVRSGRLLRAVAASGFGELPSPRLRLITGEGDTAGRVAQDGGPDTARPGAAGAATDDPAAAVAAQRRELATELSSARAEAAEAAAELERQSAAQQAVKREISELESAIADLVARRTELTGRLAQADADGLAARRASVAARRRVGELEAALDALSGDRPR